MKEQYFKMHKRKITEPTERNPRWNTYTNDGKQITAMSFEKLKEKLINYYKNKSKSFESVMEEELQKKIDLKKIEEGTRDRYRVDFQKYIVGSKLEKKRVGEATEKDITEFLEEKIRAGIAKKAMGNLITLLKMVYYYSGENSLDVAKIKEKMQISYKQYDTTKKREATELVWTKSEQEALKKYCLAESEPKKKQKALGILLMLQTGLAVSEVAQLKISDVDLNKRTLQIHSIERKHKNSNGKGMIYVVKEESAKTQERLKPILLSNEAIETFKLAVTLKEEETELVFEGIMSYGFNDYLRRHIIPDLNLKQRGLHSLRKTYATNLIDKGAPLSLVKEQMRHTEIETTMKYYYKNALEQEEKLNFINSIA